MERLESHISSLIARHNCVIVPGLGAFLAHEVPASYNAEDKIFMPPYRVLGFNPQVVIDDALLVSHYISCDNLSYDEAVASLKADTMLLRSTLSQKGVVRFGTLGTFEMNVKGEITFTPDANGIDDPSNFGFEPLAIESLEQCERKSIVIPIKRRDIGKYVAAVAAVILTFIFVTPVSDNAFKNEIRASITDFASSEQISMMQQLSAVAPATMEESAAIEIAPVDFSNTKVIEAVEPKVAEPAVEVAAEPVAEPVKIVVEQNKADNAESKYYIIVASSPSASNAELAVKELTAKKSASYEILNCGKRHRVAIDNFSSADAAQNALLQYQQTFPDAWVLFF